MTGREKDHFETSLLDKKLEKISTEDFRAKLAVCSVCDKEGILILNPKDFAELSQNMGAKRLDIIITKAQKLNKISEKDKEEIVKN